eukprot:gene700-1341_t
MGEKVVRFRLASEPSREAEVMLRASVNCSWKMLEESICNGLGLPKGSSVESLLLSDDDNADDDPVIITEVDKFWKFFIRRSRNEKQVLFVVNISNSIVNPIASTANTDAQTLNKSPSNEDKNVTTSRSKILFEQQGLNTVFHQACKAGDISAAKALVDIDNIDKNSKDAAGLQAIHYSSISGNLELIKWLIQIGAQLNARDDSGTSPLHIACQKGHLEVVQWMLTQKVFKNNRNRDGMTPLLCAASEGHLPVVQLLIAEKAFNFVVDNDGNTALHYAYMKNHSALIDWLMATGADLDAKNKDGKTPKDVQGLASSYSCTISILQSSTDMPTSTDTTSNSSSTQSIASNNNIEISNINAIQSSNPMKTYTSILAPEYKNDIKLDIVQLASLPSYIKKVRITITNKTNFKRSIYVSIECDWVILKEEMALRLGDVTATSIQSVILINDTGNEISEYIDNSKDFWKNYHEVYNTLKDVSYRVNVHGFLSSLNSNDIPQLEDQINELFQLSRIGDLIKIKDLYRFGLDIQIKDEHGRQAVHFSSMNGHLDCVVWFFENGVQLNNRDNDNMSPLHYACVNGNIALVRWLLTQNVFKNNRNSEGMTPLLSAASAGHVNIVQLLIAEKALVFAANKDGNTALHLACANGHNSLAKWLVKNGMDETTKNKDGKKAVDLIPAHLKRNFVENRDGIQDWTVVTYPEDDDVSAAAAAVAKSETDTNTTTTITTTTPVILSTQNESDSSAQYSQQKMIDVDLDVDVSGNKQAVTSVVIETESEKKKKEIEMAVEVSISSSTSTSTSLQSIEVQSIDGVIPTAITSDSTSTKEIVAQSESDLNVHVETITYVEAVVEVDVVERSIPSLITQEPPSEVLVETEHDEEEVMLGGHVDVMLGGHFDVMLGGHVDVMLGGHVDANSDVVVGVVVESIERDDLTAESMTVSNSVSVAISISNEGSVSDVPILNNDIVDQSKSMIVHEVEVDVGVIGLVEKEEKESIRPLGQSHIDDDGTTSTNSGTGEIPVPVDLSICSTTITAFVEQEHKTVTHDNNSDIVIVVETDPKSKEAETKDMKTRTVAVKSFDIEVTDDPLQYDEQEQLQLQLQQEKQDKEDKEGYYSSSLDQSPGEVLARSLIDKYPDINDPADDPMRLRPINKPDHHHPHHNHYDPHLNTNMNNNTNTNTLSSVPQIVRFAPMPPLGEIEVKPQNTTTTSSYMRSKYDKSSSSVSNNVHVVDGVEVEDRNEGSTSLSSSSISKYLASEMEYANIKNNLVYLAVDEESSSSTSTNTNNITNTTSSIQEDVEVEGGVTQLQSTLPPTPPTSSSFILSPLSAVQQNHIDENESNLLSQITTSFSSLHEIKSSIINTNNNVDSVTLQFKLSPDYKRISHVSIPRNSSWEMITLLISQSLRCPASIELVLRDIDGDDLSPALNTSQKFWKFLLKFHSSNGRFFSVHVKESSITNDATTATATASVISAVNNSNKHEDKISKKSLIHEIKSSTDSLSKDITTLQQQAANSHTNNTHMNADTNTHTPSSKSMKIQLGTDLSQEFLIKIPSNSTWDDLAVAFAICFNVPKVTIGYIIAINNDNNMNGKRILDSESFWNLYFEYIRLENNNIPKFHIFISEFTTLPASINTNSNNNNSVDTNTNNDNEENDSDSEDLVEAFHLACVNGDLDGAKTALLQGADIRESDTSGLQGIHFASISGSLELVQYLFIMKADINVCDNVFMTPLHYACELGHISLVKWMISNDVIINSRNGDGMSPFLSAAAAGLTDIVQLLVAESVDLKEVNSQGQSAIDLATQNGHRSLARWLTKTLESSRKKKFNQEPSDIPTSTSTPISLTATSTLISKVNIEDQQAVVVSKTVKVENKDNNNNSNDNDNIYGKETTITNEINVKTITSDQDISQTVTTEGKVTVVTTEDASNPSILSSTSPTTSTTAAATAMSNTNTKSSNELDELDNNKNNKNITIIPSIETENNNTTQSPATATNNNDMLITTTTDKNSSNISQIENKTTMTLNKANHAINNSDSNIINPLTKSLCEACNNGNYDIVNSLLQNGTSVNSKNRDGMSPLHYASKAGHVDIVRLLFSHNVDPKTTDPRGISALHLASEMGKLECIELLIAHELSVNHTDDDGLTPLHYCCLKGLQEVTELLVSAGADVNATDKSLNTPLHLACMSGCFDLVEWLVIEAEASWEQRNSQGKDPLTIAENFGYEEITEFLRETIADFTELNRQAEAIRTAAKLKEEEELKEAKRIEELEKVEERARTQAKAREAFIQAQILEELALEREKAESLSRAMKSTELLAACVEGDVELANELIGTGADVNTKNNNGSSPLHFACASGHFILARDLVRAGANINLANNFGSTPLHVACDRDQSEVVLWLVSLKTNLNVINSDGYTPLHYICARNHPGLIESIAQIRDDFDANMRGLNDYSLLHCACEENASDIVYMLVELGANVKATDFDRKTALHFASHKDNMKVIQCLLKRGVDINSTDRFGWTPLFYACSSGDVTIAKYLVHRGANIHTKNIRGDTCLHITCQAGDLSTSKWLVESGLDVHTQNSVLQTPFELAVDSHSNDLIRWLKGKGASLNPETPQEVEARTKAETRMKAVEMFKRTEEFAEFQEVCTAGDVGWLNVMLRDGLNPNIQNSNGSTGLHFASAEGHLKICKRLVESGAIIHTPNSSMHTPFHCSCRGGHLKTAQWLLHQGADFTTKSLDGRTALHYACGNGHVRIAEWLIGLGIDSNITSKENFTPLYDACLNGHLQMAKFLLNDNNANLNIHSSTGLTLLHAACIGGHIELGQWLVEEGLNADLADNTGLTPFLTVCKEGHLKFAKWLMTVGVNIRATGGADRLNTALHHACQQGQVEVASWLVECGLDINAKNEALLTAINLANNHGHTDVCDMLEDIKIDPLHRKRTCLEPQFAWALNLNNFELGCRILEDIFALSDIEDEYPNGSTLLHLAAATGHLKIMKTLVEKGLSVNALALESLTPLHYACGKGHLECSKYLCTHGALATEQDHNGNTYLHLAAEKGHNDIVAWLAKEIVHIDCRNNNGSTPLHIACLLGHNVVVKTLITLGAHPNSRNSEGLTPMHCCAIKGHLEVAQILIKHGSDVFSKDADGQTPLDIAMKIGYTKLSNWLLKQQENSPNHSASKSTSSSSLSANENNSRSKLISGSNSNNNTNNTSNASNSSISIKSKKVETVASVDCTLLFSLPEGDNNTYETVKTRRQFADGAIKLPTSIISENEQKTLNQSLCTACIAGNYLTAKKLLSQGADINTIDNTTGSSPLHFSCITGNLSLVKYIAENGGQLEIKNHENMTPLLCAVDNKFSDIVLYLLHRGADATTKSKTGYNLLHYVCLRGIHSLLEKILDLPLNVLPSLDMETKSEDKLCPLHCAAKGGYVDIVKILIAQNVQMNPRDDYNRTPLHYACLNGHFEVAAVLLSLGAFVNCRDNQGLTPLLCACAGGHVALGKLLLASNATINVETETGDTALHLACSTANFDTVLWLLEKGLDTRILNHAKLTCAQCIPSGADAIAKKSDTYHTTTNSGQKYHSNQVLINASTKKIRDLQNIKIRHADLKRNLVNYVGLTDIIDLPAEIALYTPDELLAQQQSEEETRYCNI